MKNVQISDNDLYGNRFNGHDLHLCLNARGIDSEQLVWKKRSDDPKTHEISANIGDRKTINRICTRLEQEFLTHAILQPFSLQLFYNEHFLNADVVHYHLIHNFFFNISHLPMLTKLKPSVWTIHDPWAITGHCIHPMDCERWKSGCGDCPNLETEFTMKQDATALNWEFKKQIYHNSHLDIVVASKWMQDLVTQSPLLEKSRIHCIPFGINLNVFSPSDQMEARAKLGIPLDAIVIAFRSTLWHLKGFHHIRNILHRLKTDLPICLLTFNEKDLLMEFREKYKVVELGWVENEQTLAHAYNAADIFLMPSLAEGFGMMAMEAMACGKPVISFAGTALPQTTFAPEGGIVVPKGDEEALLAATERLIYNPEERMKIGEKALQLARRHYDQNVYVERIVELYQDVIARRASEVESQRFLLGQLKNIKLEQPELLKKPVTQVIYEKNNMLLVVSRWTSTFLKKLLPKKLYLYLQGKFRKYILPKL